MAGAEHREAFRKAWHRLSTAFEAHDGRIESEADERRLSMFSDAEVAMVEAARLPVGDADRGLLVMLDWGVEDINTLSDRHWRDELESIGLPRPTRTPERIKADDRTYKRKLDQYEKRMRHLSDAFIAALPALEWTSTFRTCKRFAEDREVEWTSTDEHVTGAQWSHRLEPIDWPNGGARVDEVAKHAVEVQRHAEQFEHAISRMRAQIGNVIDIIAHEQMEFRWEHRYPPRRRTEHVKVAAMVVLSELHGLGGRNEKAKVARFIVETNARLTPQPCPMFASDDCAEMVRQMWHRCGL